jgi:CRISPR-associated exonuclease Cas4
MKPINGTLIASYYACKRELWYIAHEILPEQDNSFLELGRILEEDSYREKEKGFWVGDIRIDLVKRARDTVVVGEIKKSSRSRKTGIMQLYFYLFFLKQNGVEARGEVLFPKEKKRIELRLTETVEKELQRAIGEIQRIIGQEKPPKGERTSLCNPCAYRDFCFA